MPGPYFEGQAASPCSCYYPDITRVRDDYEREVRILFCINHGCIEKPLGNVIRSSDGEQPVPIPTPDEREEMRERLRQAPSPTPGQRAQWEQIISTRFPNYG